MTDRKAQTDRRMITKDGMTDRKAQTDRRMITNR
jgi:hypothetical protein